MRKISEFLFGGFNPGIPKHPGPKSPIRLPGLSDLQPLNGLVFNGLITLV